MTKSIGTRVFYVTTGGFDTHSAQNVNATNGAYYNLMATMNDGLLAFYNDLKAQGLLDDTLVLSFSEFGRRISENGSGGTDHGSASVMMAMGGKVNGGLYGTAPNLNTDPANPTLENSAGDVKYETDFRSVYAQVLDGWLGTDSTKLLGGNFRKSGLELHLDCRPSEAVRMHQTAPVPSSAPGQSRSRPRPPFPPRLSA